MVLLYFFLKSFLNTNLGIKDVVAGITLVAILRKLIHRIYNHGGGILVPYGHTQLDWQICISSVWRRLWGTTFSYSYSETQFPSTSIFRWSPTKILQPRLNKSKLLWPSSKSLSDKIRKWSYSSSRRRIGPKAIWRMKGIVIEGVTTKDLLFLMNKIQISFKRWGKRWTSWWVLSKRKQTRAWIDWLKQLIHLSLRQSWNVQYRQNFGCLSSSRSTGLRTPRTTSTPSRQH